ncbi:MAG: hypothetical protein PVH60_09745 [Anaerolineales bacterium]|jgi:hypothetical protein
MLQFGYGIFIILHGLVHTWYVTLAQRWVPFEPDMGWSGNSWLFTNLMGNAVTHTAATALYALSTLLFTMAGIGVLANTAWWPPTVIAAAITSSISILFFWDGSFSLLVQKGLLGLLINFVVLGAMFIFKWPAGQL